MHHVSKYFQVARSKALTLRAARPLLLFAASYVMSWSYLFIATFLGAKPPPAPLFPPAAVLLSALLLSPPRHWWRFLAVAFLLQMPILAYLHLPPLWNALGFLPDAIEPVVAVLLIRRYLPLPLRFASLREVSVYTACVAAAVLVATTLGSAVNAVLGGEPYWTTWVGWYLSDILACLVLAPTILLWIASGASGVQATSGWRSTEAALLYGGLLVMGLVMITTRLLGPEMADALIYLPVPLLVWAAIRFGPRGIATALALIVVLAVPAVANALGPFANQSAPAAATLGNVFPLQLFLLAVGMPLLFLAALMQERAETKATLQESEARFRTMADQAPVLIWMSGPDALCTYFNAIWLTFRGRTQAQEQGTGWVEGVHPEDELQCVQTYLNAFAERQPFEMEYRLRRHDGVYRWVVDRGTPRYAPDGRFAGYIGSALDITERKQMEEALRASEERYQAVVETQTEMITRYRPDTTLTFVNDATCRYWGRSRKELLGTSILADMPEDEAARVREMIEALLAQPDPGIVTIEHGARFHDGSLRWQQWVNRTILDGAGQVVELQGIGRDITERKRAEEALRESEARFRAAFESAAVGMALVGLDSHPLEVNHALVQMLGYSEEEVRTHAFAEFTFPEDVEPNLTLFQQAVAGNIEHYHLEKRYLHKDGHLVRGRLSAGIVRDAAGTPLYLVAHLQDITEHKQAEEALQASEARYRAVVRNLPQTVVLLFNAELCHTFADGPGLQVLGLTPEGLEGRTVWETLPGDLAAALAPHYEAVLTGQAADLDVEYAQHIYRIQVVPMPAMPANTTAPAQTPVGMVVLRDITEQRRARDELVRERTRADLLGALSQEFRTLAEHSPDLIARFDPSGHFVYVNQAGAELVGLPAEQWVGKTIAELGIRNDVYEPLAQALQEVVVTGRPRTFDADVKAPDDHQLSLHTRYIPELSHDGALQSVLVIATDISALKRAEARLAEKASELETIFESQADGVGVYDLAGYFVRANQALRDLLGLDADAAYTVLPFEERAQRLRLFDEQSEPLPFEQWPQWRVLRGEMLAGASTMEARVRTLDGRELWISITGAPLRAPDGQASGVVLIARDVTARRALERQVAEQAAELEAIFETQADGVVVYDKDGRMVRANRTWHAMFQAFEDLNDRSADPTIAALPFAGLVERWHQSVRGQQYPLRDADGHEIPLEQTPTYRALRGETVTGANAVDEGFERADGHVYVVSVSAAPLRDAAGTITGAVAVARDVTVQRQLERQVREQASQLEAIFEAMTDGVGVFDPQGRFLRANSALSHLFGLAADPAYPSRSLEEQAQRQLMFDEQGQQLPLDQMPHWRVLRGEVLSGASAMEGRLRTVDGREVWVSTTGAPMRASDGQIRGTVLITRDVTARRALERQVAEQAAATERTRLAHELHDTVTQEIYSISLLAEGIPRIWPRHRAEAEAALAQLPQLTRGALAGLRVLLLELRPTALEQLPLSALLRQLAEAMSTRAQVPIAVRLNDGKGMSDDANGVDGAEPALPPAVKLVFYRVAQEALMNAAKYANAHAISVRLLTRGAGKGKGTQGTWSTIELAIADDGLGFDPSAIPAGHFGLAMMYERAHAVGATLAVHSQLGQGTQIVATWRSRRGSGRAPQAGRQAAALHQKEAADE